MSSNPWQKLPVDKQGAPMQEFAHPVKALVTSASENGAASSVLTLNDACTTVEVAAIGASAFIRWVPTSDTAASVVSAATGANFDNAVPAGTVRRFAVPIETTGTASIVGAGVQAGLYRRIAVKSFGNASVLTTQY